MRAGLVATPARLRGARRLRRGGGGGGAHQPAEGRGPPRPRGGRAPAPPPPAGRPRPPPPAAAGRPADPCYLRACDTLRNVDRPVTERVADAVEAALRSLAGRAPRSARAGRDRPRRLGRRDD